MNIYLSKNDLYNRFNINDVSLRTKASFINKLVNDGVIAKTDNNQYKMVNKSKYHFFRDYDGTQPFIDLFKDIRFEYIVHNVSFLNEWLNQLIGKNTIIIEVDKKYVDFIYNILVDNDYKNILLDPSTEELDKYYSNDLIIIKPLFTRSPINRKEKSFTIEKVVVDLFSDKILRRFFSTSELPDIYRQIFKNYSIDESSLNAYLARRRMKEKFYDYLKNNGLEEKINN